MKTTLAMLTYSTGKKIVMALTGLFLLVFLLEHLIGNLLLVIGEIPFLQYAEWMGATWNVPLRIMEIGLFAGFAIHIVDGLILATQNRRARPITYAAQRPRTQSTWFSRHMHWTGLVLLTFLVLHLATFFMDARFALDWGVGVPASAYIQPSDLMVNGHVLVHAGETNLYQKAAAHFSLWWYTALYILAMLFLAFHLIHGFRSAFQSLGWRHATWTPVIRTVGMVYAIAIPAGFASIPIYFLLTG
ncbi:MAG: hypothetical protein ETSY1_11190 [Candidatus Entotheonella factor]|uniref:Succinate dehydrogenase n=1 Tax=Entotheonella factor TaxID=1429438 RepID=W4LQU7_ENTF1|nr:succinate dehydrogenase cytochrome b subunit [Candidatus Entotheonella palauensis]ETX00434.1 MAG: hypothetical protein ETSY1_11190 [Candidatus Entotheonella factor]